MPKLSEIKFFLLLLFFLPSIAFCNTYTKILELKIIPPLIVHSKYLASPSYLISFMDIIGVHIVEYSTVKIYSERLLSIGPGKLEFKKKEGDDYYFDTYYEQGPLKIAGSSFIRIDKKNKTASIFIQSQLQKLIPEMIISRINRKISSVFSPSKQSLIANKLDTTHETFESLEEYLIVNSSSNNLPEKSKMSNANISDDLRKFYLLLGWGVLLIIVLIRNRRRA